MPARDTNDGKDYLYVQSWDGDGEETFRVLGQRTLPSTGHFVFEANGNNYTLTIDGILFASFEVGPSSGGLSGPGFLIGCETRFVSLLWTNYGWRSIGAADECWGTARGSATFDCGTPPVCGTPQQHAGWVDHTRTMGAVFRLTFRGRSVESTDAMERFPGAILRWRGPGDFVSATPIRDTQTGVSYLYVIEWDRGIEYWSRMPLLVGLPQDATYSYLAVGPAYVFYVDGRIAAAFEAGGATGGRIGVGTLLGCEAHELDQRWSSISVT